MPDKRQISLSEMLRKVVRYHQKELFNLADDEYIVAGVPIRLVIVPNGESYAEYEVSRYSKLEDRGD